jgi:tetraacyldisaccharide 4'-kinase
LNLLSALYGRGVAVRNHLYDRGTFRSRGLIGPVVSVGNISVGGSGKTPFVIWLGEWLQRRAIVFDVLSRGYGRKTTGVLEVRPDGSAREFGDEPLLIARRLGCPVVVGQSRYQAGELAERLFGPRLHLLDDGFQHRHLARDFDIVLLTLEDISDHLLPAGRLREPLTAIRRADAVVLSGELDAARLPLEGKLVWRLQRSLSVPPGPKRLLVFCGVARPKQFVEQLKSASIGVVGHRFYPDHHAYRDRDIDELIAWRDREQAEGFITTEKDAINLGNRLRELGPVSIARVVLSLDNPADALDTILRVMRERRPAHEKILLSTH